MNPPGRLTAVIQPTFDVYLHDDWRMRALIDETRSGLTAYPKQLSPRWLYDDRGSELFDQITRLPEYYPTEAEREILLAHAGEIAEITRGDTLIELGSGTSDKTRTLLDAFDADRPARPFRPVRRQRADVARRGGDAGRAPSGAPRPRRRR